jgi:HK97 family phage prohead protease
VPTPRSDESRSDFIDRCMSDAEARRDFPDTDQRLAFCTSQYDRSREQRAQSTMIETKSLPFEAKVDGDGRTVEGFAATFDRDEVDDVIERGAFRKTIEERGSRVKFLWQHSEIIGKAEHLEEQDRGLFVRARVSETTTGSDALTLMRDGVVDRMSIGFTIPPGKSEIDRDAGVRRISEIKLFEVSAVSFPANTEAAITSVKSLYDQARRYGTDQFGDRVDEVRAALSNLEALLDGREPPAEKGGNTRGDGQPPRSTADDPDAELVKALQSMRESAIADALAVSRLNLQ